MGSLSRIGVFAIKTKIFLAILFANFMLAASMFAVSSWTFQNGFLEYVNQTELDRFEGLSQKLARGYEQQENWDWLTGNRKKWRELSRADASEIGPDASHIVLRNNEIRPDTRPRKPKTKNKLFLLDENKKLLIGRNKNLSQLLLKPIPFNNETVGYLGIERRNQLSRKLDKVFAEQQRDAYAWIALGSILISLLVAFPFAAQLIRPILELLKGTQTLASGDYSVRLKKVTSDEIGELVLAFNNMASNIEEGRLIQRQWIADISHELRTPLAVLKGEVEAIQDGIRAASTENLSSLHQEIVHLSRLVEDLHELSQSDMKSLNYQKAPLQLGQLIEEVADNFSVELAENEMQLKLNSETTVQVEADRDRLIQLFSNLLQNNLRYSGHKTTINVKLSLARRNGSNSTNNSTNNNADKMVLIEWQDDGAGVNEENLDKLFNRLYREDPSRTETYKGSGLGLSICKTIVEAHNGEIFAEESAQGGLTIKILLPGVS